MAKIRIPTPLRNYTQGRDEVSVEGKDLRDILKNLDSEFRGISEKLLDAQGNLHRFINVFVGEDDIRHLAGLNTEVKESDIISIFPAIAGGLWQPIKKF